MYGIFTYHITIEINQNVGKYTVRPMDPMGIGTICPVIDIPCFPNHKLPLILKLQELYVQLQHSTMEVWCPLVEGGRVVVADVCWYQ